MNSNRLDKYNRPISKAPNIENKIFEAFNEFSAVGGIGGFDSHIIHQSYIRRSRVDEYFWRKEASNDPLVKSIVSSHYISAVGVSDGKRKNITVHCSSEAREKLPEPVIEMLEDEANKVMSKISDIIEYVSKDGLIFGDGYMAVLTKDGVGVTELIYNATTKPYCVMPYLSNKRNDDIGYEILSNSKSGEYHQKTLARFVPSLKFAPLTQSIFACRLNIKDGTLEQQEISPRYTESINPFQSEESYYQDSVHSGLLEGLKDSYDKYISSIDASIKKKIASSMVDRFITIALNTVTEKERNAIKNRVTNILKASSANRAKKLREKNETPSITNFVIPTTGDNATGSVEIQESSIDFKDNMEDTLFHIKRFIAGMRFHPQLTAFSENTEGGREDESVARTSEQIEEVGASLRKAITSFIMETLSIHLYKLSGKHVFEIDKIFEIEFNAVTLPSKREQEIDRVESLNNQSQFNSIVSEFKEYGFEDNGVSREILTSMIRDIVPLTISNDIDFVEKIVGHILKAKL